MRVLLDECVPRALRNELPGHSVKTVAEAGWAGAKNGELLQLAAGQFDLLLTVDRNFEYQQNFAGLAVYSSGIRCSTQSSQRVGSLSHRMFGGTPKSSGGGRSGGGISILIFDGSTCGPEPL